jgi:hypothetical protein
LMPKSKNKFAQFSSHRCLRWLQALMLPGIDRHRSRLIGYTGVPYLQSCRNEIMTLTLRYAAGTFFWVREVSKSRVIFGPPNLCGYLTTPTN